MKLAKRHWNQKPQQIGWIGHAERRKIVRLRGGVVQSSSVQEVSVRASWWRGGCRHVVLDVKTRRRVDLSCPDCRPPGGMK